MELNKSDFSDGVHVCFFPSDPSIFHMTTAHHRTHTGRYREIVNHKTTMYMTALSVLPFLTERAIVGQDDPEVRSQIAQIHVRLDAMEKDTLAYKKQFSAYEYLWTTNLQAMFREFLK